MHIFISRFHVSCHDIKINRKRQTIDIQFLGMFSSSNIYFYSFMLLKILNSSHCTLIECTNARPWSLIIRPRTNPKIRIEHCNYKTTRKSSFVSSQPHMASALPCPSVPILALSGLPSLECRNIVAWIYKNSKKNSVHINTHLDILIKFIHKPNCLSLRCPFNQITVLW